MEAEKNPGPVGDVVSKTAFSPNSQAYKSVREKKAHANRKGMRRSMSFSEGQSPVVPIIHKSGYNEEASSKYNVVTNCQAPAHDEAQNSSDKIKVIRSQMLPTCLEFLILYLYLDLSSSLL